MVMSPATIAAQVPSYAGFASDVSAHLLHGVVVATPEYFIMARPVRRDAEPMDLLNPWTQYAEPDGWMVWLAAGDLRLAMTTLWPLLGQGKVWLAFQRDGPAKWCRASKLLHLYGQGKQRPKPKAGDQVAESESGAQPQGWSPY